MSDRETNAPGTTGGTPSPSGAGATAHPAPDSTDATDRFSTAQYPTDPAVAPSDSTAPEYSTRPVAVRRADTLAGLLLLLAGVAAGVSLLLRWLNDADVTGLDLVRSGFHDIGATFGSGLWQPMAIVLGGGVLFVLGLLLLIPARTHHFLGALALVVSLIVAAGVLVPLADAGWHVNAFDLGFWFAMAVPALGLLGALKALLTGRKFHTR